MSSLQKRLEEVQKKFPPDDCKVFLNPCSDAGFDKVLENFVSTLERLQAFVENGYSTEGLPFSYKSIERF